MSTYAWEPLAGVGVCVGGGGKNSVSVYKSPLICHVREFGLDFNNISTTPGLKVIYLNTIPNTFYVLIKCSELY